MDSQLPRPRSRAVSNKAQAKKEVKRLSTSSQPPKQRAKPNAQGFEMVAESRMNLRDALSRACKTKQQQQPQNDDKGEEQRQQQQQQQQQQVKEQPCTSKVASKKKQTQGQQSRRRGYLVPHAEPTKSRASQATASSRNGNRNKDVVSGPTTSKAATLTKERRPRKTKPQVRPFHDGDAMEFFSENTANRNNNATAKRQMKTVTFKLPGTKFNAPLKKSTEPAAEASRTQPQSSTSLEGSNVWLPLHTKLPTVEVEPPSDRRVDLSEYGQEEFLGYFGLYTHEAVKKLLETRQPKRKRRAVRSMYYGTLSKFVRLKKSTAAAPVVGENAECGKGKCTDCKMTENILTPCAKCRERKESKKTGRSGWTKWFSK